MFFINPPYGTGSNVAQTKISSAEAKAGTSDTNVRSIMEENKIGAATQDLYTQFMYRIDSVNKLIGGEQH